VIGMRTQRRGGPCVAARSCALQVVACRAELRRYDVGRLKPGTRYASQYPEQEAADGERLPTLAELFALVKKSGNTCVRLALETKITPTAPDDTAAPEPFARALIKAIRLPR